MSNFNKVIIAGNLTRDPEYKQVGTGQALCRLGLASNRQYKNKQTGAMVQEVCFVDIDVWGAQAESCRQYLQKGKQVLIEGRLKLDTWKDNEGQNRSKHGIVAERVVFLGTSTQQQGHPNFDDYDQQTTSQQDNGLDKDILDKLNDIKKAKEQTSVVGSVSASSKPKKKKNEPTDEPMQEIEFQDEAPFEDQLPF